MDWERLEQGIQEINAGLYFEAHETLEEAWRDSQGDERTFLQALIHVAVGSYHAGRGNTVGARRQWEKACVKLRRFLPVCEGIDTLRLEADVRQALVALDASTGTPAPLRIHRV